MRRLRHFQNFIDQLLANKLFKSSLIVHDFLTIKSEHEFEKKKDIYSRYESTRRIRDTKNLEGLVTSKINEEMLYQHELIEKYNEKVSILLEELSVAYTALKEDFRRTAKTLGDISHIHKQLHDISCNYSDPPSITQTFQSLYKINSDWSKAYENQISILDSEFREMFEYFREDLLSYKEESECLKDFKEDYVNGYIYLLNKKEKLFSNNPVSKWEAADEDIQFAGENILSDKSLAFKLMCRKETLQLEDKKIKFGVMCYGSLKDRKSVV